MSALAEQSHQCPCCDSGTLSRWYSAKRRRYYWHCAECDTWRPDHGGAPGTPAPRERAQDVQCWHCGSDHVDMIHSPRTGSYHECASCRETWDPDAPMCPDDPEYGPMRRRKGRNGGFFGCRRYPMCVATRSINETEIRD